MEDSDTAATSDVDIVDSPADHKPKRKVSFDSRSATRGSTDSSEDDTPTAHTHTTPTITSRKKPRASSTNEHSPTRKRLHTPPQQSPPTKKQRKSTKAKKAAARALEIPSAIIAPTERHEQKLQICRTLLKAMIEGSIPDAQYYHLVPHLRAQIASMQTSELFARSTQLWSQPLVADDDIYSEVLRAELKAEEVAIEKSALPTVKEEKKHTTEQEKKVDRSRPKAHHKLQDDDETQRLETELMQTEQTEKEIIENVFSISQSQYPTTTYEKLMIALRAVILNQKHVHSLSTSSTPGGPRMIHHRHGSIEVEYILQSIQTTMTQLSRAFAAAVQTPRFWPHTLEQYYSSVADTAGVYNKWKFFVNTAERSISPVIEHLDKLCTEKVGTPWNYSLTGKHKSEDLMKQTVVEMDRQELKQIDPDSDSDSADEENEDSEEDGESETKIRTHSEEPQAKKKEVSKRVITKASVKIIDLVSKDAPSTAHLQEFFAFPTSRKLNQFLSLYLSNIPQVKTQGDVPTIDHMMSQTCMPMLFTHQHINYDSKSDTPLTVEADVLPAYSIVSIIAGAGNLELSRHDYTERRKHVLSSDPTHKYSTTTTRAIHEKSIHDARIEFYKEFLPADRHKHIKLKRLYCLREAHSLDLTPLEHIQAAVSSYTEEYLEAGVPRETLRELLQYEYDIPVIDIQADLWEHIKEAAKSDSQHHRMQELVRHMINTFGPLIVDFPDAQLGMLLQLQTLTPHEKYLRPKRTAVRPIHIHTEQGDIIALALAEDATKGAVLRLDPHAFEDVNPWLRGLSGSVSSKTELWNMQMLDQSFKGMQAVQLCRGSYRQPLLSEADIDENDMYNIHLEPLGLKTKETIQQGQYITMFGGHSVETLQQLNKRREYFTDERGVTSRQLHLRLHKERLTPTYHAWQKFQQLQRATRHNQYISALAELKRFCPDPQSDAEGLKRLTFSQIRSIQEHVDVCKQHMHVYDYVLEHFTNRLARMGDERLLDHSVQPQHQIILQALCRCIVDLPHFEKQWGRHCDEMVNTIVMNIVSLAGNLDTLEEIKQTPIVSLVLWDFSDEEVSETLIEHYKKEAGDDTLYDFVKQKWGNRTSRHDGKVTVISLLRARSKTDTNTLLRMFEDAKCKNTVSVSEKYDRDEAMLNLRLTQQYDYTQPGYCYSNCDPNYGWSQYIGIVKDQSVANCTLEDMPICGSDTIPVMRVKATRVIQPGEFLFICDKGTTSGSHPTEWAFVHNITCTMDYTDRLDDPELSLKDKLIVARDTLQLPELSIYMRLEQTRANFAIQWNSKRQSFDVNSYQPLAAQSVICYYAPPTDESEPAVVVRDSIVHLNSRKKPIVARSAVNYVGVYPYIPTTNAIARANIVGSKENQNETCDIRVPALQPSTYKLRIAPVTVSRDIGARGEIYRLGDIPAPSQNTSLLSTLASEFIQPNVFTMYADESQYDREMWMLYHVHRMSTITDDITERRLLPLPIFNSSTQSMIQQLMLLFITSASHTLYTVKDMRQDDKIVTSDEEFPAFVLEQSIKTFIASGNVLNLVFRDDDVKQASINFSEGDRPGAEKEDAWTSSVLYPARDNFSGSIESDSPNTVVFEYIQDKDDKDVDARDYISMESYMTQLLEEGEYPLREQQRQRLALLVAHYIIRRVYANVFLVATSVGLKKAAMPKVPNVVKEPLDVTTEYKVLMRIVTQIHNSVHDDDYTVQQLKQQITLDVMDTFDCWIGNAAQAFTPIDNEHNTITDRLHELLQYKVPVPGSSTPSLVRCDVWLENNQEAWVSDSFILNCICLFIHANHEFLITNGMQRLDWKHNWLARNMQLNNDVPKGPKYLFKFESLAGNSWRQYSDLPFEVPWMSVHNTADDTGSHWVVSYAAPTDNGDKMIYIFDSCYGKQVWKPPTIKNGATVIHQRVGLSEHLIQQLHTCYQITAKTEFCVVPMQQQTDVYNCGFFAIAGFTHLLFMAQISGMEHVVLREYMSRVRWGDIRMEMILRFKRESFCGLLNFWTENDPNLPLIDITGKIKQVVDDGVIVHTTHEGKFSLVYSDDATIAAILPKTGDAKRMLDDGSDGDSSLYEVSSESEDSSDTYEEVSTPKKKKPSASVHSSEKVSSPFKKRSASKSETASNRFQEAVQRMKRSNEFKLPLSEPTKQTQKSNEKQAIATVLDAVLRRSGPSDKRQRKPTEPTIMTVIGSYSIDPTQQRRRTIPKIFPGPNECYAVAVIQALFSVGTLRLAMRKCMPPSGAPENMWQSLIHAFYTLEEGKGPLYLLDMLMTTKHLAWRGHQQDPSEFINELFDAATRGLRQSWPSADKWREATAKSFVFIPTLASRVQHEERNIAKTVKTLLSEWNGVLNASPDELFSVWKRQVGLVKNSGIPLERKRTIVNLWTEAIKKESAPDALIEELGLPTSVKPAAYGSLPFSTIKLGENRLIQDIFGFYAILLKRCDKCKRTNILSAPVDPLLMLWVNKPLSRTGSLTLQQCINSTLESDHTTDYTCNARECGHKTSTECFKVLVAPEVLLIGIKRFGYDTAGKAVKDNTAVECNDSVTFGGSWYSRQAVITHRGKSVSGGHFVSMVKHYNRWYSIDDQEVRQGELYTTETYHSYIAVYVRNPADAQDNNNNNTSASSCVRYNPTRLIQ